MHVLLLALGALVTAIGAVMLAFSVPLVDAAGVALFTSGATAVVGGLILIGLAAAVRSLSRIAERLDIQPMPLPSVASVEHEAPRSIRARQPAVPAATASEVPKSPEASAPGDAPKPSEAAPANPALLGWLGRAKGPATSTRDAQAEPR